eukprot:TRINITY_DN66074_c0_g2_i1.p1 TRINITY_DN66074_c0_g2~~TRINITY_DN66074_c0_g2_i1.p1  ORF type:complete len:586 (+),score=81.04 TRINITY_DN66074_c0_g2_i1:89-1759(+)
MDPPELVQGSKKIDTRKQALDDLETAFFLVSDSASKTDIEFSFLESSSWPVRLEDIIGNLEAQRARPGAPFQLVAMPPDQGLTEEDALLRLGALEIPAGCGWIRRARPDVFRLCGVGDHLTATYDTILMVESALQQQGFAAGNAPWRFERSLLGRFCPQHAGQRHQCRQRCELLGVGCDRGSTDGDGDDPLAAWLGGVIHAVTLEELSFDLEERITVLAGIVQQEEMLSRADLILCSHPVMLCILLAAVASRPIFTHASSTLLYGMPCHGCENKGSSLRSYSGEDIQAYLSLVRNLLLGQAQAKRDDHAGSRFALLAEGRFLSEQIDQQVAVRVQWVPPLALYITSHWSAGTRRNALVLRSRFFVTLMGELLRSLMREVASINNLFSEITFLGKDNQFDEQWLSLEQMAGYGAAVLYPNDIHQRTFHEVYKMGVPLLMPDVLGMYRLQRLANWGYTSYGGRLQDVEAASMSSMKPWWDSFKATPDGPPAVFQRMADWEQMPHVQRFQSVPALLDKLQTIDLSSISRSMISFHKRLTQKSLGIIATSLSSLAMTAAS